MGTGTGISGQVIPLLSLTPGMQETIVHLFLGAGDVFKISTFLVAESRGPERENAGTKISRTPSREGERVIRAGLSSPLQSWAAVIRVVPVDSCPTVSHLEHSYDRRFISASCAGTFRKMGSRDRAGDEANLFPLFSYTCLLPSWTPVSSLSALCLREQSSSS